MGDAVNGRNEIHRHGGVVDLYVCEWSDKGGEAGTVNIHKAIDLTASVSHGDTLFINVEVRHGNSLVLEVHGEIPVNIDTRLFFAQETCGNARVPELVIHLANLHEEITPFLTVIGEQTAFLGFLCNNEIGLIIRVLTSLEIVEIGIGQELMGFLGFILEMLSDKDVLFVNGITLS
jgi:hypothetical protein